MKAEILKIAGVKSEKEFYNKFPTKEAFMKAHRKEFQKAKRGKTIQDKAQAKKLNQLVNFTNNPDEIPVAQNGIFSPAAGATSGVNPALLYGLTMGINDSKFDNSKWNLQGASPIAGEISIPQEILDEQKRDAFEEANYQRWKSDPRNELSTTSIGKDLPSVPGYDSSKLYSEWSKPKGESVFDKLGGAQGIAQGIENIAGGISQAAEQKRKIKELRQQKEVTGLMAKASASRDVNPIKNIYVRPEDMPFAPEQLYPSYGTGTNILAAKKGGKIGGTPTEIQNTYVPPTDIYSDLEYIPRAKFGLGNFASQGGASMVGGLTNALTGNTGEGKIASTVLGTVGTLVGGPFGNLIGQGLGGLIGGLFSTKAEEKRLRSGISGDLASITGQQIPQQFNSYMENGGKVSDYKWVSHTWTPQLITHFGEHSVKDLLKPDETMDTLRTGGNLRQNQFALGGELQTTWGGYAEPIAQNPHLPGTGEIVMFRGNSHDESDRKGRTGIGVKYGNDNDYIPYMEYGKDGVENVTDVEVERNEPATELIDPQTGEKNMVVFGDIKITPDLAKIANLPEEMKNKKFKHITKEIAQKTDRQNKIKNKAFSELSDLDVSTPFDKLKLSSLKATIQGSEMKNKKYASQINDLANLQSVINEHADRYGSDPDDLLKGKFTKNELNTQAKMGKTIHKAQDGKNMEINSTPNNPTYVNIAGGDQNVPVFYDRQYGRWRFLKPRPGEYSKDGYGEYVPEKFNQSFTNQYYNSKPTSAKTEKVTQTRTASAPRTVSKPRSANIPVTTTSNLPIIDDSIDFVGYDAEGFPIVQLDESATDDMTNQARYFKTPEDIANYYKQFGYTGKAEIGELQKWIRDKANQDPRVKQELTTYLRRQDVPLTNLGKRKYKGKSKSQLSDDQLIDQFVDNLWEFRFPKMQSLSTPSKTYQTTTQTNTPTTQQTTTAAPQQVQPVAARKKSALADIIGQVMPYLRPSDAEALDMRQIYPELSVIGEQPDPVVAQLYHPQLKSIYDVSLQDQVNEVTAQARAAERMAGFNPAAAASIMGMASREKSKILGEQTRMNQALQAGIIGENINTLNDAQLKNLAILDQQYQRQSQAKSNTKATKLAALQSIGNKYMQNQLNNRTLQTYENMYAYRFGPDFRAMNYNAPFVPVIPDVAGGQESASKSPVKTFEGNDYLPVYNAEGEITAYKKKKEARNGSIVKALKNL